MTTNFQDTLSLFNRYAAGQELTTEEINWLVFGLYTENRRLQQASATAVNMNNVVASGPIEISGVTVNRVRP